jgi:hypothetical protein
MITENHWISLSPIKEAVIESTQKIKDADFLIRSVKPITNQTNPIDQASAHLSKTDIFY